MRKVKRNILLNPGPATTTGSVKWASSVIPSEAVVLIINNGAYGQRMCQIAHIYGFNVLEIQSPPDAPIDLTTLETLIQKSSRKISHLAVVHHETTTGY
ncbi:aspartate aminotransferase-like enzyme [Caldalkalibacillus uzonensis]|uniref:Aspartate aminotransferase-like enzyme n=1 Tax=Caldalkalibacillus uzonensis TaxID=353224 RepID=A0ABU0CRM4_9BACI|nr:aspartate aminotransferase-like enzyme [Caldalkalibacillus uzonensis]